MTVSVKPLIWSESRVFGSMKRRGSSPFGEWTAFVVDGLTPAQIAAKEAQAQASYEAQIRTAIEEIEPDIYELHHMQMIADENAKG